MNYTEIQHRLDVPLMDFSLYKEGDAYVELVAAQVSAFEDTPKGMLDQEIPRQEYIYYRHTGLVDDIADSFGSMYHWAADNDIPAGEMKIDPGYTPGGKDLYHDLYINVEPSPSGG